MVLAVFALVVLDGFFAVSAFWLYVLLVWWLGFEANHIHSVALERKGWGSSVNIIAPDALNAEKAYFSRPISGGEEIENVPETVQ